MKKYTGLHASLAGGAALLAMATFSLVALAKLTRAGTSQTTFEAAGPAGLAIHGSTTEMSIADDGATITLTVPLTHVATGIALRDEHLKKALETDTYPTTTLAVPRAALKFPAAGAESSGDAKGSMTLHGTTRDVTFHYVARLSGDTLDVKGRTRINVDDFGVKRPSYLGVTVKPDVDVETAFQAKDN